MFIDIILHCYSIGNNMLFDLTTYNYSIQID